MKMHWDRPLSPEEIEELKHNPWQLLDERRRKVKKPIYKHDWFWMVLLPLLFIAAPFALAALLRWAAGV